MTTEEKQLLLKDLCSRLPYGVKIHNPNPKFPDTNEYIQTLTDIHGTMLSNWITFGTDCEEINVKLYELRWISILNIILITDFLIICL